LKYNNMEDSKSDHYIPMSWQQCHKMRSILKVFWKVAYENLLVMACKYHA
jgi:hypothetical protein